MITCCSAFLLTADGLKKVDIFDWPIIFACKECNCGNCFRKLLKVVLGHIKTLARV